jgi:ACDE family multidrug resistance protein
VIGAQADAENPRESGHEPPTRRPPISLIFAVTATGIMANSLIAPVVPDIVDDLGVSDAGSGFIIASVALPGVVMAPVIGLMADRIGRRRVLVPCLMLFALAGLIVMTASSFQTLVIGRLIQGIGAAGLINLAVVIIGDHWHGAERTRLIGRNAAVLTVGLATFPLLSGLLAEFGSWRVGLAPQLLALGTAAAAWRLLDDTRPEHPGTLGDQLGGLATALRRPVIAAVIASGFVVFVLVFGVFLATLPLHLERQFGLGAGARGAMLALPAVTASLVAFNLGRLTNAIGYRLTLLVATSIFVASFALMGTFSMLAVVAVACALYGLGDGALIPILQDSAVAEAPAAMRGGVVAVWVGAARLGQTVGPLLAAAVFTASSTSTALLAGAAVAAGLLIALAFAPIGRPRPAEQIGLPTGR